MDSVLWLCPSLPTETLKCLSSLPILMQESFWWWQCSDRYIISLFPHLHNPLPPFSPSLINLMVSVDIKHHVYLLIWGKRGSVFTEQCTLVRISLAWLQDKAVYTSRSSLDSLWIIVQELCESRGGHPGLSVLTSLLVFLDVKNYWTVPRRWSQLVPNMSTDIWGH